MTEKEIEMEILDWLNRNGIFAFKIDNGGVYDVERKAFRSKNRFSPKGVSDILAILPGGRLLALEVKTETGRASVPQMAFIEKIKKSGGVAAIVRSLNDVKEVVNGYWDSVGQDRPSERRIK